MSTDTAERTSRTEIVTRGVRRGWPWLATVVLVSLGLWGGIVMAFLTLGQAFG